MDNNVCIGYAVIACKKLGMTDKELQKLEATLRSVLDEYTSHEALEAFRKN